MQLIWFDLIDARCRAAGPRVPAGGDAAVRPRDDVRVRGARAVHRPARERSARRAPADAARPAVARVRLLGHLVRAVRAVRFGFALVASGGLFPN